MKLYRCTLVNSKGYVEETIWREAESKKECKEGINFFQWPKGDWKIEEVIGEEGFE